MFEASKTKVLSLLNDQTRYAIPAYQRPYAWQRSHAAELIEDLMGYRGAHGESQLFLGNVILQKHEADDTQYVVDGQQRLTTMLILLVAARTRATELGNLALAHQIQQYLTFVDATTAASKGPRLQASESIRDVFELIVDAKWDGDFPDAIGKKWVRRQRNKIRPVYECFRDALHQFSTEELSGLLQALYNALVIAIRINDPLEALGIFERTNARGEELEVADLLKNYLFTKKVEGIEDAWETISLHADGQLLRMIKYFYVAQLGYAPKAQLYKNIKSLSESAGAAALTASLGEFGEYFAVSRDPVAARVTEWANECELVALSGDQSRISRLAATLQALRFFKQTQYVPLLYSVIKCAVRSQKSSNPKACTDAVLRLAEALERFHFVNNVVCERMGNEIERVYADRCKAIAASDDVVKHVDQLLLVLRERRAPWEEFKVGFCAISYDDAEPGLLAYIFDRFSNFDPQKKKPLEPGMRLPIFKPEEDIRKRSWNIEHFAPQKPVKEGESAGKPENKADRVINNIGNLLILYHKTNSSLGNSSPAEKVKLMSGKLAAQIQNQPYVSRFLSEYGTRADTWNAAAIQERAEKMAEEAHKLIWSI